MTEMLSGRKLFLGLAALIVITMALLAGGERGAGTTGSRSYTSFLEDVEVLNIQGGDTAWRAISGKVRLSDDGTDARLEDVVIVVPSQDLSMSSPSGSFDVEENTLDLEGNIVTQVGGFTVRTDSVRVVPGGKVRAGDRVTLTGKGVQIEGRGLEAGDEQTLRLKRDVKAVFE
jgi:hypothetical protein